MARGVVKRRRHLLLASICSLLVVACATHEVETRPRPDVDTDMAAVLAAEDARRVDPALVAALDADDPTLRLAAARALGRIGARSEIDRLQRRFAVERDAAARAAVVEALGRLDAVATARVLRDATRDADPDVRIAAARALDLTDERGLTAALRLLDDEDDRVFVFTAYALTERYDGDAIVRAMIERLPSANQTRRLGLLFAISRFTAIEGRLEIDLRRAAREVMLAASRSQRALERMFAAHGLSRPTGEAEAARLGELTEDPEPLVRIEAIRALSFIGAPVEPFLIKTILDPDERVAMATVVRLGKMKGPDVLELLANYIQQEDRRWFRLHSFRSFAESDLRMASGVANGLAQADDEWLRYEIARIMPGEPEQLGAREALARLAADTSPFVREALLPALGTLDGSLETNLAGFLEDDAPSARLGVVGAAAYRFDDEDAERRGEAWEVVRRVWDAAREDGDLATLEEVLDRMAARSDAASRPFLVDALDLPFRPLQEQAAAELRSRGESVDLPPAEPPLPRETYRAIAEWAASPRAAIVTVRREGFRPGRFTLRLATDTAPLASRHFARLAESGFYDRTTFDDFDPGREIFGGSPLPGGRGRPDRFARDELVEHAFGPGTVALVRDREDRLGSRFMISTGLQPRTADSATVVGRVVQNYNGVVARILPGDEIVSIEIYEGDGTEPLP